MSRIRSFALLLILLGSVPFAGAAAPVPAPVADVPGPVLSEADEIARLEALPANHIPLRGATLGSAVRLLAGAAQMSYLAPPDSDFSDRITSDVTMNPYELLKVLGTNYNLGFEYESGLWRFYRINLNELVTKAYTIRFDNGDRVSINATSINSQLAAAGGGMSGGSTPGSPSQGGGFGGGKGTFDTKTGKIIEDIKKILSLPTVGLSTPSLDGSPAIPGSMASRRGVEAPRIEPIWNPDTSQLFVVATRQQHSLIAAYLKAVDRPQKLIRIAVKFVETTRNPTQAFGVDWSNTFLGSGGPISISGIPPSSTSTSGTTTTSSGTNSTSTTLPVTTNINLAHPLPIQLPTALLSAPAFQWTIQAIASDTQSSIVQDPVIYTSNNREVSFNATTQEPIQQGTTTIGSSTAATTSSIAYIDVGTELNILPGILPGAGRSKELIQLNLAINVSSIIGTQVIGGNPYPVTSSRTYSYSVLVPNGETLAIAGLEERSRQTTDNKIPIFGDIPIIGYAFKNRNDSVVKTTLFAFITPQLIDSGEGDASDTAEAAAALPVYRHRIFEGSKSETLSQVDESLAGLPADISALEACANSENRERVLNRLERIGVELDLMEVRLVEIGAMQNRKTERESAMVEQDRSELETVRARVDKISTEQDS